MTDKPITEDEKDAIALAKARNFKDGSPDPFLAQMKWEEHLMKEQQRLNRRTVLLSVIISSILGMLGIIGGAFLQYHLERSREAHYKQIQQGTNIESPTQIPPAKLQVTSTMNETSSSQPPVNENNKQNR